MCRSAGSGDDDLDSPAGGLLGVLHHAQGASMGRDHGDFVGYTKFFEAVGGTLHDGQVALASHDDAHAGGFFGLHDGEWLMAVSALRAAAARLRASSRFLPTAVQCPSLRKGRVSDFP